MIGKEESALARSENSESLCKAHGRAGLGEPKRLRIPILETAATDSIFPIVTRKSPWDTYIILVSLASFFQHYAWQDPVLKPTFGIPEKFRALFARHNTRYP